MILAHITGGYDEIFRDYSTRLTGEEEKKSLEKAIEAVQKGWAIGPFDITPFPNQDSPSQAIITKSFTIPKHKWLPDGTLRLIFHKSFPLGQSVNTLTPRHDFGSFFPLGPSSILTLAN